MTEALPGRHFAGQGRRQRHPAAHPGRVTCRNGEGSGPGRRPVPGPGCGSRITRRPPRDSAATASAAVGSSRLTRDRAPDAILHDAGGEQTRLFASYRGPHFTAIAYGPHAAQALDRLDWPPAGAQLKRLAIDGAATRADQALTDTDGTFRQIYGLTEDTLLLIRPDGYISHIATRDIPPPPRSPCRHSRRKGVPRCREEHLGPVVARGRFGPPRQVWRLLCLRIAILPWSGGFTEMKASRIAGAIHFRL
jgi:hypothetical protein